MRGSDDRSGSLFSYVDLEARVRPVDPLRTIREIANAALADLSKEFGVLYPPRLGRALLHCWQWVSSNGSWRMNQLNVKGVRGHWSENQ